MSERQREASAGAAVCGYCGQPFVHEEHLALHRGLAHSAALDDAEREAFRTAHADEDERLRLFRLKVVLVLVFVYFGFLLVYALVV